MHTFSSVQGWGEGFPRASLLSLWESRPVRAGEKCDSHKGSIRPELTGSYARQSVVFPPSGDSGYLSIQLGRTTRLVPCRQLYWAFPFFPIRSSFITPCSIFDILPHRKFHLVAAEGRAKSSAPLRANIATKAVSWG